MTARADAARDAGRYRDAALLYEEVLRLSPNDASIHVQCGHMYKEAGDLGQAETHYVAAKRLMPHDAEIALQMGHFHKVAGRLDHAETFYRDALRLKPGWADPSRELDALYATGWRGEAAGEAVTDDPVEPLDLAGTVDGLARARIGERLVPEIAPRRRQDLYHAHRESIQINRLGRHERSHWGLIRTLRGVEALRGFCTSIVPIVEVQIALNGLLLHRGPPKGGFPLVFESARPTEMLKYVFNVWYDFSGFAAGRHEADIRFLDAEGTTRAHREVVVIAAPLAEADYPNSSGIITPEPGDGRPLDDQVESRPSMIKGSQRHLLSELPRTVLIQRVDQLGDMVVSIPAIRRLRDLLPGATFVGLLSPANVDLARSLGLFDEVIVVDFPDDTLERRRIMPLEQQEKLRARLAPFRFDMAIDLSEGPSSRPLLLLSGAPFLCGFRSREFPWLTVDIEANTHERFNAHEVVPHTNKLMGMVEYLGAMLGSYAKVIERPELSRALIAPFGLSETDRFVILHAGARLKFSQWPGYKALATKLLLESDLKVVLMVDSPADGAAMMPDRDHGGRLTLIDGRIAFDEFDALLSFCSVFVGNDSGPKHLASLRGAKVVSIHMARTNWNEWGQENGGYIISRKVPCAGCIIHHDPEECGRDFSCMTGIKADEVFGAVKRLLE